MLSRYHRSPDRLHQSTSVGPDLSSRFLLLRWTYNRTVEVYGGEGVVTGQLRGIFHGNRFLDVAETWSVPSL